MDNSRKTKLNKSIVALALLACLVAFSDLWSTNPNDSYHQQQKTGTIHFGDDFVNDSELTPNLQTSRQLEEVTVDSSNNESPTPPQFAVCSRVDGSDLASWPLQRKYLTCPEFDPQTPMLVLEGYKTFGWNGNRLRSLLNAVQYTRDKQFQLAIMYDSWAMGVVLDFFIASDYEGNDDDWKSQIEKTLCVKIIHLPEELEGWKVDREIPRDLFNYRRSSPYEEYVASQLYTLRTLFQHYNTGEGQSQHWKVVGDMCSRIDSLFGKEEKQNQTSAIYSTIHLRNQEEHPGRHLLAYVAHVTGCGPMAALEMKPDYVKSILEPLGMLEHPIIVITDGQNELQLERLLSDPDIGPMISQVKTETSSFGRDVRPGVKVTCTRDSWYITRHPLLINHPAS